MVNSFIWWVNMVELDWCYLLCINIINCNNNGFFNSKEKLNLCIIDLNSIHSLLYALVLFLLKLL